LRDVAVYYHFAISTFPVKIVIKSTAFILEYLLQLPIRLASAAICKNGGVTETFDWDEEEVSYDKEETRVQVLMALADDELSVGKNHARNGEWIDITMKKIVLGPVIDQDTKPVTPSILTEVMKNDQESKINELTKLVQMLMDEKINSTQMTQEFQPINQQPGSSKSVNSSKQSSKPNGKNTDSSKPDPLQHEMQEREDHMTLDHDMPIASLKRHNHVILVRGGILAESSQSSRSSTGRHIKEPIWYLDSGCSRSMTGVKSYLHKYIEQPGPKQGTMFNANKEIMLIAPRRNDVYVLDMLLLTLNRACFFAKSSESVNWLWHKRLSHLNFKNINKLAKQNKVLGLPSLVYSKDKLCSACKKGKHKRASFKTKQNFSIIKCLHLLHIVLFGLVNPMLVNHEKYTLVIDDDYSRTEFRNSEIESFCDEKGISQNLSSPYTLEQNGVAERKNRAIIEAARTMLNGSILSKKF
ncbi:retrovirus-related pol polyprotein from transposon TNT 1-94, partial [Tanacetum coccineum]